MVDNESSEMTPTSGGEESNTLKQAACHGCRRSKVKCVRPPNAAACRKCASAGIECVVPQYHVGRYKGVKNKRSGLDKAIHQVEEAVKKARTKGSTMHHEHTRALRQLLRESEDPNMRSTEPPDNDSLNNPLSREPSTSTAPQGAPSLRLLDSGSVARGIDDGDDNDDVTVNNANNPLQLLAIASSIPEPVGQDPPLESNNNMAISPSVVTATADDEDTRDFFSPMTSKLDVGSDLDPLDLGLVSEEDVEGLFN